MPEARSWGMKPWEEMTTLRGSTMLDNLLFDGMKIAAPHCGANRIRLNPRCFAYART